MLSNARPQTISLSSDKELKTLVENRKAFTLSHCELNVFETYEKSHSVALHFNDLVVTSMLRGKKKMYLYDQPGFDYLPGETLIVPANEKMFIDFPEAESDNPTQCIALAIDADKISNTLHFLNEKYPRENKNDSWQLSQQDYHLNNNSALSQQIDKVMRICLEDSADKDILADLALQELLIRIMQQQNNASLTKDIKSSNSVLHHITAFIRENISEKLSIDLLAKMAYMSKASFYRLFKKELGINPTTYILQEKIRKAKQLLSVSSSSIGDTGYQLGFPDVNYFHRQFKKAEGITPSQFKRIQQH